MKQDDVKYTTGISTHVNTSRTRTRGRTRGRTRRIGGSPSRTRNIGDGGRTRRVEGSPNPTRNIGGGSQDSNSMTAQERRSLEIPIQNVPSLFVQRHTVGQTVDDIHMIFYRACAHGHIDTIKRLFKDLTNINFTISTDTTGNLYTSLLIAVNNGRVNVVHFLLENGANPNIVHIDHTTHCQRTDLLMALQLFIVNRNVRQQSFGEIITALLNYGANPNEKLRQNPDNYVTPFTFFIAKYNLVHSVQKQNLLNLFLNCGADVNTNAYQGMTPLMILVITQSQEIASKTQLAITDAKYAINLLLEHGADPNIRNDRRQTVLVIAVEKDDVSAVKTLLEYTTRKQQGHRGGAASKSLKMNINLQQHIDGKSILLFTKSKQMFDILIKHGVDPNYVDPHTGRTVLMTAVVSFDVVIVRELLLLPQLTTIDHQDKDGNTALLLAAKNEPKRSKNATPSQQEVRQGTATANKMLDILRLLVRHRANPLLKNNKGETALMYLQKDTAIWMKSHIKSFSSYIKDYQLQKAPPLIRAVIKNDIDSFVHAIPDITPEGVFLGINVQDVNGNTALHHAILHNNTLMCERLLHLGADPNIKNNSGESSFALAVFSLKPECVDILLRSDTIPIDDESFDKSVKKLIHTMIDRNISHKSIMYKILLILLEYEPSIPENALPILCNDVRHFVPILLEKEPDEVIKTLRHMTKNLTKFKMFIDCIETIFTDIDDEHRSSVQNVLEEFFKTHDIYKIKDFMETKGRSNTKLYSLVDKIFTQRKKQQHIRRQAQDRQRASRLQQQSKIKAREQFKECVSRHLDILLKGLHVSHDDYTFMVSRLCDLLLTSKDLQNEILSFDSRWNTCRDTLIRIFTDKIVFRDQKLSTFTDKNLRPLVLSALRSCIITDRMNEKIIQKLFDARYANIRTEFYKKDFPPLPEKGEKDKKLLTKLRQEMTREMIDLLVAENTGLIKTLGNGILRALYKSIFEKDYELVNYIRFIEKTPKKHADTTKSATKKRSLPIGQGGGARVNWRHTLRHQQKEQQQQKTVSVQPVSVRPQLTFVSWNIFYNPDRTQELQQQQYKQDILPDLKKRVLQFMNAMKPLRQDIICLQECPNVGDFINYIRKVATNNEYKYGVSVQAEGVHASTHKRTLTVILYRQELFEKISGDEVAPRKLTQYSRPSDQNRPSGDRGGAAASVVEPGLVKNMRERGTVVQGADQNLQFIFLRNKENGMVYMVSNVHFLARGNIDVKRHKATNNIRFLMNKYQDFLRVYRMRNKQVHSMHIILGDFNLTRPQLQTCLEGASSLTILNEPDRTHDGLPLIDHVIIGGAVHTDIDRDDSEVLLGDKLKSDHHYIYGYIFYSFRT